MIDTQSVTIIKTATEPEFHGLQILQLATPVMDKTIEMTSLFMTTCALNSDHCVAISHNSPTDWTVNVVYGQMQMCKDASTKTGEAFAYFCTPVSPCTPLTIGAPLYAQVGDGFSQVGVVDKQTCPGGEDKAGTVQYSNVRYYALWIITTARSMGMK